MSQKEKRDTTNPTVSKAPKRSGKEASVQDDDQASIMLKRKKKNDQRKKNRDRYGKSDLRRSGDPLRGTNEKGS